MRLQDLIERARAYATSAHARINQLRKYTRQPYDVHLKSVAELVAAVSDDAAMIAASSVKAGLVPTAGNSRGQQACSPIRIKRSNADP